MQGPHTAESGHACPGPLTGGPGPGSWRAHCQRHPEPSLVLPADLVRGLQKHKGPSVGGAAFRTGWQGNGEEGAAPGWGRQGHAPGAGALPPPAPLPTQRPPHSPSSSGYPGRGPWCCSQPWVPPDRGGGGFEGKVGGMGWMGPFRAQAAGGLTCEEGVPGSPSEAEFISSSGGKLPRGQNFPGHSSPLMCPRQKAPTAQPHPWPLEHGIPLSYPHTLPPGASLALAVPWPLTRHLRPGQGPAAGLVHRPTSRAPGLAL